MASLGDRSGIRGRYERAVAISSRCWIRLNRSLRFIVHKGRVVQGAVQTGDAVHLSIDAPRREAIRLNHSATHIMHSALRELLGSHVRQAGSLVTPDRLRFDFTHTSPVKDDVLDEIENLVNHHIRENAAVTSEEMSFTDAIQKGALAFFGEKYGEIVRVLRMGDFSTELCGGTHVSRTGDVGLFKFKSGDGRGVRYPAGRGGHRRGRSQLGASTRACAQGHGQHPERL